MYDRISAEFSCNTGFLTVCVLKLKFWESWHFKNGRRRHVL